MNIDVLPSAREMLQAKTEEGKIARQAELNAIDVGERYAEAKAGNKLMQEAVEAVAPGADVETVMRNYMAVKGGDKEMQATYGEQAEAIDKFLRENEGMVATERPEGIRASIKEETGVDVDAAIKKEPGKRTEEEAAAVEDYLRRLYPEQSKETETNGTAEIAAQKGLGGQAESDNEDTPIVDERTRAEENVGEAIGETPRWGKVYQWGIGKFKDAVNFLIDKKSGLLQNVFHRDEIGDISIGWGDAPNDYNGRGLAHIIRKHIDKLGDFRDVEEMANVIEDVVEKGVVRKDSENTYAIEKGDYRVVIAKDSDGNWILSAFDYKRSAKDKLKRFIYSNNEIKKENYKEKNN